MSELIKKTCDVRDRNPATWIKTPPQTKQSTRHGYYSQHDP